MIESVPNFSEGRDPAAIECLCNAIAAIPGAYLLHATSDPDHNRTVITLAGERDAVQGAALAAMQAAMERIDLSRHAGVHPRIGALDVLPFVPLGTATMEECAALAVAVSDEIWARFRVPAFLYEAAARTPERRALEYVRRAGFTGQPDIGAGRHPTAGAVAVGARNVLVAWNIWLETKDVALARTIARAIRFSSGGFAGVKALGLPLASRGLVQVSINSTDFAATPLHLVFQSVERLATEAGVQVSGSELIGLIPARALELSAGHDLRWFHMTADSILEHRLSQHRLSKVTQAYNRSSVS